MDMFKTLKDMSQMKSRFGDMQNKLQARRFTGENGGVTVTLNGLFGLEDIKISPELINKGSGETEAAIKECMQMVNQQVKDEIAKELKSAAGSLPPGMSGMFGG